MPTRIPWPGLPPVPDFPATRDVRQAFGQWHNHMESWRVQVDSLLRRNWNEIELLPRAAFGRTSAALTLTTAFQDVPSLTLTVNVPLGGNVYVHSVLDMDASSLATNLFGVLNVTYPTGVSSQQSGQIRTFTSTNGPDYRLTLGNLWAFTTGLPPGAYTFTMRARKSTNTEAMFVSTNSGLFVMVF